MSIESNQSVGNPENSYVVLPDLHGQYELAARALDRYDLDRVTPVFLGDFLDRGPSPERLLGLVREVCTEGGVALIGNHEWVCRNALTVDDERSEDWREIMWRHYEAGTLHGYDLDTFGNWQENARMLAERMGETGDLAFLENDLRPSFETADFVAVHAGPMPDRSWEQQRADLEKVSAPGERLENEPEQIFSKRLAQAVSVPKRVDERMFITGHAHFTASAVERRVGNRICLASQLGVRQPLYVWESQTDRIAEILLD